MTTKSTIKKQKLVLSRQLVRLLDPAPGAIAEAETKKADCRNTNAGNSCDRVCDPAGPHPAARP